MCIAHFVYIMYRRHDKWQENRALNPNNKKKFWEYLNHASHGSNNFNWKMSEWVGNILHNDEHELWLEN